MNLRIVGPTPMPSAVQEALGRPMIYHRGPEMAAIHAEIIEKLQTLFQTKHDVFVFTSSGTGGMESAIVNIISPGDKVLALSCGVFGDRFAQIAETYGAQVIKADFPWGQAIEPSVVDEMLTADPDIRAVLVTHNETSTGITNPLQDIARVVREHGDVLLLVDAISSLGAIDLPVDAWGCDVVVTGSQKSWMIPPGLSMVSVSPRAWEAAARCKTPRFYFDFASMKKAQAKQTTPFTPGVSLFFALQTALRLMTEEGLENIFARHKRIGEYTRKGVKALGLELFADQRYASNTVTSIRVPPGIEPKKLRQVMEDEYDVVIAGGQRRLANQIVRIGHLGLVSEEDIDDCLEAMGKALEKLRRMS